MAVELTPHQLRVASIFMPYEMNELSKVIALNSRFVHYTSAGVLESILKNKCVWMRNATTLNDSREVQHGVDCLTSAYNGESGRSLTKLLETLYPGSTLQLKQRLNDLLPSLRSGTYLTCVSRHLETEDHYGRLSMWRAYGGATGVALVLNNTAFKSASNALGVVSSPVLYSDSSSFAKHFGDLSAGILKEVEFVQSMGRESLLETLHRVFLFAAVCTKHPGFSEEQEWRIIYSPYLQESNELSSSIEVVNGTPQLIYKIPLKNFSEMGLSGMDIPDLIDRIIIGPTQYPTAIFDALCRLLDEAGMTEPEKKIVFSDIPLRVS